MPQFYCTLDAYVSNTKTYFPPETKKLTQQHNWKKKFLQPMRSECILLCGINFSKLGVFDNWLQHCATQKTSLTIHPPPINDTILGEFYSDFQKN
jgi:hypothetical protein